MKISRERLLSESQATGFRPEVLEKVIQLLSLLEGFNSHPFLKGRLVLKGGTALNLFLFDVPRLSVDVDLNYIGVAVHNMASIWVFAFCCFVLAASSRARAVAHHALHRGDVAGIDSGDARSSGAARVVTARGRRRITTKAHSDGAAFDSRVATCVYRAGVESIRRGDADRRRQ